MAEKHTLIVKKFEYDGYFVYKDFYRVMDVWFREKFYDKEEKLNEEYRTPTGKHLQMEFIPWKKVTDYFKIKIKVNLNVDNLRDVTIKKDGKTVKVQQGKITGKITGYLVVDYESKWNKPLQYFYRFLMDRYIYLHITKKYEQEVISDVNDLSTKLTNYLNVTQY